MSGRAHIIFQYMKHHPTRIRSLPSLSSFLALACILAACDPENMPEPEPDTEIRMDCQASGQDAFQGSWLEEMPENVIHLAGYRMEMNFCRDSMELRLHNWTDEIGCTKQNGKTRCQESNWIDAYKGTWTVQDSILRIEYRQSHAGIHVIIDTTRREVAFRITSGPGETMGLSHQGREGEFLTDRMEILLQRAHIQTE